ncbi:hypothetical protein MNBD_NITROSPIRAE02-376 [hydrothermal vent metagenome]|uniref:Uncharacterized protein n=1 Tax=hydrothermal vent metagenome TaxID=652676 RepID=A0A3B1DPA4_9ZZZZ
MHWLRIKKWFHNGVERLRWLASLFSERLHIELAIIKLLNNLEVLRKKREEIVLRLGERVLQLKESPSPDVFTDQEIRAIIKEIEAINEEIEAAKSRVSELSKLED